MEELPELKLYEEIELHELKLHEEIKVKSDTYALRVPGGWVYSFFRGSFATASVFVPFSCEFSSSQTKKEGDNPK